MEEEENIMEDDDTGQMEVDGKLYCEHCDFVATESEQLKQHQQTKHKRIDENKTKLKCELCSFVSLCRNKFRIHMDIHLPQIKEQVMYPCDNCDFVSECSSSLEKHIKLKHGQTEISSNVPEKVKLNF